MCPLTVDKVQRPAYVPLELVDKLGEWFKYVKELHLVGVGEPTLSPSLWRALEWTKGLEDTTIHLFTNGLLLDDDKIDKIIDSKVTLINFSCDAATKETYKKIRGGDFNRLTTHIRRFRQRREAYGKDLPQISMNMTLMKENIAELPAFVELAASLGAEVISFWPMSPPNSDIDWTVERDGWKFVYEDQWLGHIPEFSNRMVRLAIEKIRTTSLKHYLDPTIRITFPEERPALKEGVQAPKEGQIQEEKGDGHLAQAPESVTVRDCIRPWSELMVLSTGVVRTCWFQGAEPGVGNLNHSSLEEIWNGPIIQELRRDLSQGKIHPLCANAQCVYVAGSKREDDAEKGSAP